MPTARLVTCTPPQQQPLPRQQQAAATATAYGDDWVGKTRCMLRSVLSVPAAALWLLYQPGKQASTSQLHATHLVVRHKGLGLYTSQASSRSVSQAHGSALEKGVSIWVMLTATPQQPPSHSTLESSAPPNRPYTPRSPQAPLWLCCVAPAAGCQPGHQPAEAGAVRIHWPCAASDLSMSAASPAEGERRRGRGACDRCYNTCHTCDM